MGEHKLSYLTHLLT